MIKYALAILTSFSLFGGYRTEDLPLEDQVEILESRVEVLEYLLRDYYLEIQVLESKLHRIYAELNEINN